MSDAASNPFSASRLRPGAIPYVFPAGQDAAGLIIRLALHGWRGEIVGPHGSGKSALWTALLPAIEQAGRRVVAAVLHDGQRRLPHEVLAAAAHGPPGVLAVDGCEQLGWWPWLRLRQWVRRRGWGLLITTHVSRGLPLLAQTAATPDSAGRIAVELQRGRPAYITKEDAHAALARCGGDLREALFALYDLYEQRAAGARISAAQGENVN